MARWAPKDRIAIVDRFADTRSEGDSEAFFAAHGLGQAYRKAGRYNNKKAKISSALIAADARGDADDVLDSLREHLDGPAVDAGSKTMKARSAVEALEALKAEVTDPMALYGVDGGTESWTSRVLAVLRRSLGPQTPLIKKISEVGYGPFALVGTPTPLEYEQAFAQGTRTAVAYIEAALYELRLEVGDDDAVVVESAYDPELWNHVRNLVDDEDWAKVASQTAIFVEDKVRAWMSLDGSAFGKAVYAKALADTSALALGGQPGEAEGWRMLGMGLAQALGNVDRHRIQNRADAKRYALGVLGLGSLILTQLRYQHPGETR